MQEGTIQMTVDRATEVQRTQLWKNCSSRFDAFAPVKMFVLPTSNMFIRPIFLKAKQIMHADTLWGCGVGWQRCVESHSRIHLPRSSWEARCWSSNQGRIQVTVSSLQAVCFATIWNHMKCSKCRTPKIPLRYLLHESISSLVFRWLHFSWDRIYIFNSATLVFSWEDKRIEL